MLPIFLREPSSEPARRRTGAALARRPAPAPPAADALLRDREHAVADLEGLADRFAEVLGRLGVTVSRAATATAAAERIAAVASGSAVATTRAAILGELQGALTARGLTVVPTYGPDRGVPGGRLARFWQLPSRRPTANWRTAPAAPADDDRRDVVGLLGVNAAAAATGAVYLVQHSSNIGELLRTARALVFVVGLDKLTENDAAARRQVEAVTARGTDTVLLDLSRTRPADRPLERFAPAPGPPRVEVVLLDNGRSALAGGRYRELLACIGCRACATRCPTYPLFRGERGWSPKDYLWSHLRGENPTLELCTFCGNCEVDCPVDIPLPALIAGRRSEDIARRGRGVAGWQRRVEGEVERLGRAFSAAAPLGNRVQRVPLAGAVMERVFGLAADRPLPRFRRDTFERWHAARGPRRATRGRRLVYYFGCFANYNDPEVGQAAVEVLEALGHEVVLPRWRCCGIPLYAKGEIAAARRMAETNVAALAAHVDAGDEIVTSCPSCHLALARDYPRLFPSPAADRVAAHTQFLSRLLLADEELPRRLGAAAGRAAYHLPCHLRALGMERDSVELLGAVPGLSVTSLERGCCGLSGTFGLERARYAQSMEIGGGVFTAVEEGGFDQVLTDCGACKMQLEHGTGRSVSHPLEVLRRALVAGDAMPAAARALGAAR